MRKKIIASILMMAMTVSLFTGCGKASDANTYIMTDVQTGDHPTALATDYFAKLVKKETKGRVNIKVYHGSDMGTESEQVEQVACGGIDFARTSVSPISDVADADLKAFQALYLYKSDAQMWKVLNSSIGDDFLNSSGMESAGLVGLSWFTGGSRNFYNNDHEVKSPSDLSGLTLRVNTPSMMALLDKAGATSKNVAYGDILASIKDGSIQGAENNWPSYISTEHYKVAKYITMDGHSSVPEMLIASKEAFDKMSKEDQKIVKQCAKKATAYQIEKMADYEKDAIKEAEKAGCKITKLSDSELEEFQQLGKEVNEETSADYMDIINEIQSVE